MEIAIAVLIGVIIYMGVISQLDKKEAVKRERDLLNRIMARDYVQYVQGENIKPLDVNVDYEKWDEEEQGIQPV